MGVSKNRGTPKWMVYSGKPLLKWMIWGYHYFRKHPYTSCFFCGFSRALVVFTSSPMLMRTPSPYLGEYIASVGLLPRTVSLVGCINNPHFAVWDFRSICVPTTGSAHWGKLTIQLDPARMVVLAKVKLGPRKFVVGMLVVLRLRNLTNRYQEWWALENVSPFKRWLF